jgi:hypothetical protein
MLSVSGPAYRRSSKPIEPGVDGQLPRDAHRRLRTHINIVVTSVLLFVLPAGLAAQLLQVSPSQLSFTSVRGGDAAPSQSVTILPSGPTPVNFVLQIAGSGVNTPSPSWLTVSQASGTTPGVIVVATDQTGLAASSTPYTASILVNASPNNAQNPVTIPVSLTVSDATAQLVVTPTFLRFGGRLGASGILEQAFAVDNSGGGGALSFTTSIAGHSSWLSDVTSGQIVPNSPALVRVDVNTQNLAVGSYHDIIQITSSAGSVAVPVSLFISDRGPILSLSASGIRFPSRQGSGSSTPRTVLVQNLGDSGSTVNWTADLPNGSSWLNLSATVGTSSATSPGTLILSPNASTAGLPAGGSYTLVRVSDANALNSPQYVVAVLDNEPSSAAPVPELIPAGLFFKTAAGAPPAQPVNVYTSSTTPVAIKVAATTSDGSSWLSATLTTSNASTQTPGQISVSVNPAGLAPGTYTGGINVALGSVVQTVNVSFIVVPSGCIPNQLVMTQTGVANNFVAPAGWPVSFAVQLNDNCGFPVPNASVFASFTSGDAPLSLGGDQQTGTYWGTWQPSSAASSVAVTFRTSAQCCGPATGQLIGMIAQNSLTPPTLLPNGVLNIFFDNPTADTVGRALAPGGVIQVYGTGLAASLVSPGVVPLLNSITGTYMLIGKYQVPLFFVAGSVLAAQIPFEIAPNQQYPAIVSVNNALTLPVTLDIVPLQPGVLFNVADQSVVAQRLDGSLASVADPAHPNETLTLYLAGMGGTNPLVPTGTATPLQQVPVSTKPVVTLDGQNVNIGYWGLTPTGIGLYQINFTVPANAASGSLNLAINQGGVAANLTTLPVAGLTPAGALTLTPNPLNLSNVPGTLTVTLSAPAGAAGQLVNLASSNTNVATLPATITIPSGTESANVTVTLGNAPGSSTITASALGFTSATSVVNVAAAGQPTITATSGTPQNAAINAAFQNPLVVTVKDANGNPMSGIAVTFTAPASGASGTFAGSLNTATTNGSGVAVSAIFNANGTVGSFTVTASAAGIATPATFSLTNTLTAGSITASSGTPQSTLINTAFPNPLVATVKDAANNPISGVTVRFAAPPSGASGTFAGGVNTATTNASGVATSTTFTANNSVGNYTVTASVDGIPSSASFSLTNTAAAPASIAATGGTPQSAQVNSPFPAPLVATVKDSTGKPVSGVTVLFKAPTTGATGTFAGGVNTATTDVSGFATSSTFTAGPAAGAYTVTASVAGVATPASFSLSNTAGLAASIAASAGTPQTTPINSVFPAPLRAIVKDAAGNPVPGVNVTFAAPASGPSGTFLGGAVNSTTDATGVAMSTTFTANGTTGTYVVTASAAGVAVPASFTLTNAPGATSGTLTLTVVSTVGQSLQGAGTVHLPQAAPSGGVSVTITTSDPSKVLLANGQTDSGSASLNVSIPQGSNSANFFVHGVSSSGSGSITASAVSYSSGSAPVALAPSGFVIAGPGGFGTTPISTSPGVSTPLTVTAALLDSALHYVQTQAVAGGVTASVSVISSTPAVGTIAGSPAAFTGGSTTAIVQFNAVAAGSASVTVGVPTGFSAPSQFASVSVTVAASTLTTSPVSVGKNLEAPATIVLGSVASSQVPITIASNNPSQLLLAVNATDAGSPSIVVKVQAGFQGTSFFVYGLASSGSATYSASAPGFGAATGTVNLTPSGIVISGPSGASSSFVATVAQGNQPIFVYSARLDSSSNFVETMPLTGGSSVSVAVTSSNASVGTIVTSPVTITAGNSSAATQFRPVGAGTSTLTVATPAGFSTPAASQQLDSTVSATIVAAGLAVSDSGLVGQNLVGQGNVAIAQPQAGGLQVTLTSNDPRLLLSTTGTDKGFSSIKVTIPPGGTQASYFIYSLASSGTATYTASATGFASRTSTIGLAPSGVLAQGISVGGQQFLQASVAGGPVPLSLVMGVLDAGGNFLASQPLAGSNTVTVSLTSSVPTVGTITPSVTIPAGGTSATATFTPKSAGPTPPATTIISISTPAGYSTVANNTVKVFVNP